MRFPVKSLLVLFVLVAVLPASALGQQQRVFVSSQSFNGDLGGLAGADASCLTLATTAGLGGDWAAWLSTDTVDASTRLTPMSGPFVRAATPGVVIAADIPALLNAFNVDLTNDISVDENGAMVVSEVWTGTAWEGTSSSGDNCSNWTDGTNAVDGDTGFTTEVDDEWTEDTFSNCATPRRIYCFEVAAPVPTLPGMWGPAAVVILVLLGVIALHRRRSLRVG